MVQASTSTKNIWVAASDGDLDRVRYLIESGQSPNVKDSNSYTPMHAAASYAHYPLLTYLLSIGGNINLPDSENETPLFTCESVECAQFLITNGADISWTNDDGLTAADFLEEEHPEISEYLRSLLPDATPINTSPNTSAGLNPEVSALAVDNYANEQTSVLMEETRRIMEESERDGTDPDARLREVVERAVREGFSFGGQVGDNVVMSEENEEERKRTRGNEDANGNGDSGV